MERKRKEEIGDAREGEAALSGKKKFILGEGKAKATTMGKIPRHHTHSINTRWTARVPHRPFESLSLSLSLSLGSNLRTSPQ